MALVPGSEIKVAFRYQYLGQNCENVQSYIAQGAAVVGVNVAQLLEALWNDYKGRLLAISPDDALVMSWGSLFGEEVGGTLEFGEYPIPIGERQGERTASSQYEWLPGTLAGGFRQTVATRLTRPGQKRFPFLQRGDVAGNILNGTYLALLEDVAGAFCSPSTLGAPALAVVMQPIVVHEPGVRDPVRHVQDVASWLVNTNATSQVSRKLGHGS